MMTTRHLTMTGVLIAAAALAAHAGGNDSSSSTPKSEPLSSRSWEQGSPSYFSAGDVRRLQSALNEEMTTTIKEDGVFGPQTRAALRQFQVQNSLNVTGDPDTATLQALGLSTDEGLTERMPASVDEDPE